MKPRTVSLALVALLVAATLPTTPLLPRSVGAFTDVTASEASWETEPIFPRWVDVALGRDHACAVERVGDVWCWGHRSNGATATWDDQYEPRRVGGLPAGVRFVEVAAGYDHTCARSEAGAAWCWGANWNGQLGNAAPGDPTITPQRVVTTSMSRPVASLVAGFQHTCAIDVDGRAWCWGLNSDGQLGIGSGDFNRSSPALVADLGATVSVISAGRLHTCAVSSAGGFPGQAWCWGQQGHGRLGNANSADLAVRSPTLVSTAATRMPGPIVDVGAGREHSCAIEATGSTWCWGLGEHGRLGNGDTATRTVPQAVSTGTPFTGIAVGHATTCAWQATGEPSCWGRHADGEVGDGPASTGPQSPGDPGARLTPSPVTTSAMSHPVTRIGAGALFTCALARGDVWCWGRNDHGRLTAGPLWVIYDNPQPLRGG